MWNRYRRFTFPRNRMARFNVRGDLGKDDFEAPLPILRNASWESHATACHALFENSIPISYKKT